LESICPDMQFKSLYDIQPEDLLKRDIRLLILDLDNTVSPYKVDKVTEKAYIWASAMKKAGITLFIVSNNRGRRPECFADQLGVPYINRAGKPSPRGVQEAMAYAGVPRENTALVGDQIYTDMLCARLAGVTAILVEPIKFTYPWLQWRYWLETPFRKTKDTKKEKSND